jgi:hypothetical protein
MKTTIIAFVALAFAGASVAARADVQPAPTVGRQITITAIGSAGWCFDSLPNLKLSEKGVDEWSGDRMDAFVGAHTTGYWPGVKVKVLTVLPTYTFTSSYGIDAVKPIKLLIESPFIGRYGFREGYHWQGHTCWWEFAQNSEWSAVFPWYK